MNLIKASWKLLSSKQKKYVFFIFFLMFVGMILESLSVGIIIPLISVILKGNFDTSFFSSFFVFGNLIIENLLYVGLLVTFIIFVIKNLVLVFNLWQQTNFLRQLQFETTNRLFKHYLGNDYIFFIENNSGHLYRNLTDVVGNFVSYIRAHIILLSEAIVFLGIISILFYLDFVGTLIILFLTIALALLIYFSTIKKSIKRPIAINSTPSELKKLIQKRSYIYSKALYKVDCDGLTKKEIVKEILNKYES